MSVDRKLDRRAKINMQAPSPTGHQAVGDGSSIFGSRIFLFWGLERAKGGCWPSIRELQHFWEFEKHLWSHYSSSLDYQLISNPYSILSTPESRSESKP
ncbi:hypothetical protein HanIR_Chr01g0021771 [Helianthus annuus]|nr:hypothetical protein HanIR_Chr01g0021771 [Helianthus annuus]